MTLRGVEVVEVLTLGAALGPIEVKRVRARAAAAVRNPVTVCQVVSVVRAGGIPRAAAYPPKLLVEGFRDRTHVGRLLQSPCRTSGGSRTHGQPLLIRQYVCLTRNPGLGPTLTARGA